MFQIKNLYEKIQHVEYNIQQVAASVSGSNKRATKKQKDTKKGFEKFSRENLPT